MAAAAAAGIWSNTSSSSTMATTTTKTPLLSQTQHLHALSVKTNTLSSNLPILVSAYTNHHSLPISSLGLYSHLRSHSLPISHFALPSLLKSCSLLRSLRLGQELHSFLLKTLPSPDLFVFNSLVHFYAECSLLASARQVFDEMPDRDVVSYSTLIRSYAKAGVFSEAMLLIRDMLRIGLRPSEVTLVNMVSMFADVGELTLAKAVHAYSVKLRSTNLNVGTSLVDMYSKCGSFTYARTVFYRMPDRSTATWSAMIAGCIRAGEIESAMGLLAGMDVAANEITMLSLVIEIGLLRDLGLGKWVHCYVVRNGFEMSVQLGSALVDMYCKCGDVKSARMVFDRMRVRDVMTWTAMIAGYSETNCFDEGFELFVQMKRSSVGPNEVTVVNLLTLCAEASAVDRGRYVHGFITKKGIITDIVLATALVDMYLKCGETESAYRVFGEIKERDVCIWNAMINGLAMNGLAEEANRLFVQMETEGKIKPNDITFIGLLRACSHAGLVAEGKQKFHRMQHEFNLSPKIEHYGCMVDLLARAGFLQEALEIIKNMPIRPNIIVWGALLAACKIHKNSSIADIAAREIFHLQPNNSGYNVLISNLYATEKRWNEVASLRTSMKDSGIKKTPGLSSIELNGTVHKFTTGEFSHAESKKIHEMIEEMQRKLKEAGHVIDTSVVFLNVDDEEKENALNYHSEKLAMAYGLIKTSKGTPLRIVKNLRVCDDCHASTKLLSKIYDKVIIVRDRNRFHRFSDGLCSCGDFW